MFFPVVLRVKGLGLGLRVWGLGFRDVSGSGFRVLGYKGVSTHTLAKQAIREFRWVLGSGSHNWD